jgi:hypothetical protein
MEPPPSVSNKSKAYFISNTSSSVKPGRSKAFALNCLDFVGPFFIQILFKYKPLSYNSISLIRAGIFWRIRGYSYMYEI